MKRMQISFSVFAAVLGLTAAFAFTPAPAKPFNAYWFNTDIAGNPTTYDPNGPACLQSSGDYCAKEYNAADLNFSGMTPVSVKAGHEDNQILARHKN